ncbi:hypothetical protein CANCADRAFT_3307 [Tortispora caseinolytica NRRL Y-17796]|uniref:Major facilitator superfamily (MFS) profile domain-containing protein n=1 Tax=Tortispora caseinolytica NRRL Y-17796 TaxID=767744 RepID=A0A1E4TAB1_9ASCO|nr:hypothetical protein CANCADRAFT_3307 [Tortispora caseinolytica NRRL Y-17796]
MSYTKSKQEISSYGSDLPNCDDSDQDSTLQVEALSNLGSGVFSRLDIINIVCLMGFSAFFSAASSGVYLPALPLLQRDFKVDEDMLYSSVVTYLVMQGISPAIWCPLADSHGRRIIIISCFVIYILANIGLALSEEFYVIIILRALQAAGIASTTAITNGVVGDITSRSNRAKFMGITICITLLGSPLGPVLGGLIASRFGWQGIFWFLVIAASAVLLAVLFLMPETSHSEIGDGSVPPRKWKQRLYVLILQGFGRVPYQYKNEPNYASLTPKKKFDILATFKMFRHVDMLMALFVQALQYTLLTIALNTFAVMLEQEYHLSVLEIGLCYLPAGVGCVIGSMFGGLLFNKFYNRTADQYQSKMEQETEEFAEWMASSSSDEVKQPRVRTAKEFPIHYARLALTIPLCWISGLMYILFGWLIEYQLSFAGPIVSIAVISMLAMPFMMATQSLIVDLFPDRAASSGAAVNMTRCLSAAVGMGVTDSVIDTMGIGWAYTFMGLLAILSSLITIILITHGKRFACRR